MLPNMYPKNRRQFLLLFIFIRIIFLKAFRIARLAPRKFILSIRRTLQLRREPSELLITTLKDPCITFAKLGRWQTM